MSMQIKFGAILGLGLIAMNVPAATCSGLPGQYRLVKNEGLGCAATMTLGKRGASIVETVFLPSGAKAEILHTPGFSVTPHQNLIDLGGDRGLSLISESVRIDDCSIVARTKSVGFLIDVLGSELTTESYQLAPNAKGQEILRVLHQRKSTVSDSVRTTRDCVYVKVDR